MYSFVGITYQNNPAVFESLLNMLEQVALLDDEDRIVVKKIFKPFALKKGAYFIQEGRENNKMGFLTKGLVYYYVYKNDEIAITDFTREGEFVSEYHTFIQKKKAIHSIKAVEDCELLILDYDGLQTFFTKIKEGNKIGRMVLEHRFAVIVTQLLSLYMHNPEQRYINFIENYKDLSQRIPQYLVAAYIGVRPQSLSRIRNRIARPL